MFQGHITIDGLQAHEIREFVLFDSAEEDINMVVDISDWEEITIEGFRYHKGSVEEIGR
ncbi:MAG: hypothetical protein ABFS28_09550 [Bacteroidota bacterium]